MSTVEYSTESDYNCQARRLSPADLEPKALQPVLATVPAVSQRVRSGAQPVKSVRAEKWSITSESLPVGARGLSPKTQ